MSYCLALLISIYLLTSGLTEAGNEKIPILGYFEVFTVVEDPTTGHQIVKINQREVQFLESFLMAVDEVQSVFNSSGFELSPVVYTGQVEHSAHTVNDYYNGAVAAFSLETIPSDFPIILGSDALALLAFQKVAKTWNLINVIATSRTAEFSDHSSYGNGIRMLPSEAFGANVLANIITYFKWKKIAVFYNADVVSQQTYTYMLHKLYGTVRIIFEYNVVKSASLDYDLILRKAKASGATIFVFLVDAAMTANLLHFGSEVGTFNEHTQVLSSEYCDLSILMNQLTVEMNLTVSIIQRDLKGFLAVKFNPRYVCNVYIENYFMITVTNSTIIYSRHYLYEDAGKTFLNKFQNRKSTKLVDSNGAVVCDSSVDAEGR
jgi:hypothetical protein